MTTRLASELDLPEVLALVAAHARTRRAHELITRTDTLLDFGEGVLACRLTAQMSRLVDEEGTLSFAGVDEAEALCGPDVPAPREIPELLLLVALARRVAEVRRTLLAAPGELDHLHELAGRLPDTQGLVEWASSRLGRDGQIPDSASPLLAQLRRRLVQVRGEVVRRLEAVRRAHADAATDAPPTLRRDRYCLPVRAGARAQLPGLVLDSSGSGATVYLEPYEVVELNNTLADSAAREQEEIRRIVDEVAAAMAEVRGDLARATGVLAALDAAQARVRFGRAAGGRLVEPGGDELILHGARHPLLDRRLHDLRAQLFSERPATDPSRDAVPLDFRLPPGTRTLVVSGPNAGGKTIVLKTLGVMVLLAYRGVPLPVDEGTSVPRLDQLWAHVGDEQNVAADLSTFSGAMAATGELLEHAGPRTLALFDELGAGTDPLEGAALGCALLEELGRRDALTVATTHLAAIALYAGSNPGMGNAAMEYDETRGRPTYELRLGRPGRSRGLEIAAAMGLPEPVLERSRALLGEEHLKLERWLERLEQAEAALRDERAGAARELAAARRARSEAEAAAARLDEERRALDQALVKERDRLRRRAREQLETALAVAAEAAREHRAVGRREAERLRAEATRLETPRTAAAEPSGGVEELAPGEAVRIRSLGSVGVLQELRGGRALVAAADKRLWVPRDDLEAAPGSGSGTAPRRTAVKVEVETAPAVELNLIGLDAESARAELEHFLDRALASGRAQVRVVHGHGTGTLRRMVREVCGGHPAVHAFRHPPQHLGGSGVTEVTLEGADG